MEGKKLKKAAITSQKLVEICLHEFQKNGFDKTTMRDLAAAARMSPGAFYYHFPSKEAVIQVFYERSFVDFQKLATAAISRGPSFEARFGALLKARLDTFSSHRELLIILSRSAVDPLSSLSPFAEETKKVREDTIAILEQAIEGSDLKANAKIRAHLAVLLWMYMMALVFFWIFDKSPKQAKTYRLIDTLTPLIVRLIRFSRFPLTGTIIQPVVDAIEIAVKP